jgi:hypothetical protein
MKKLIIFALIATVGISSSCNESFFDIQPQGAVSIPALSNKNGVNAILIGAYSLLDGVGAGNTGRQSTVSNYVFGGITSGDAVKGTDAGDQPEQSFIEQFNWLIDNTYFLGKWQHTYDGIARANDAIQLANNPDVKDMTAAEKAQVIAEARFLRGHYHFEGKKMWKYIPYIDDKIYSRDNPNSTKVPNDKDKEVWDAIELDFSEAAKVLPAVQAQKGRATKWSALAYLAKVKMFRNDFAGAKPILEDVYLNSGKTLVKNYHDNYRSVTNNNSESIFEVEFSINDGSNGNSGNQGDNLNYPYLGTAPGRGCCGFYLPSQNLVNAFKTTATGLPMIGDAKDGTADTYNTVDLPNDQGLKADVPFTLDKTIPVDPRLDWTVGRRGVNFLDWGAMPGATWIRDQNYSGPYTGKKWMYYSAEEGSTTHATNRRSVNNNFRLIKLSSVILWLAECEAQIGSLAKAEEYVNLIRNRAKNGSVQDGSINYVVNPYPAGTFASKGKDYSLNAIYMENRLEFAMEGHRFFDLVRWGIADKYINKYLENEFKDGVDLSGRTYTKRSYLKDKKFDPSKHLYFPIPGERS